MHKSNTKISILTDQRHDSTGFFKSSMANCQIDTEIKILDHKATHPLRTPSTRLRVVTL